MTTFSGRSMNVRSLRVAAAVLAASVATLLLGGSVLAQDWVQPERSQANLDALARVQIRSYAMPQADGEEIEYGLYVPTGYDASRPTPLVVALHGLGSGIMYMMEYNNLVELAEDYGYIVATPMGYNERGWYGSRGPGNEFNRRQDDPGPENLGELSERDVMNVLQIVRDEYNVDPDRTYLIGQSMGGGGSWHFAILHPDIWAAVVPMAPAIYSDPAEVVSARDLPFMVIQGDADELVDPDVTRRWVAKLEELGMDYEYIEVPGGTHASAGRLNIDKVFAFLSQHHR
jgi:predicted peptidase